MTEAIDSLHFTWCTITQQELHKMATQRLFHDFHVAGFSVEDLTCVLKYMQFHNKKGGGRYKIQAHKILGDLEVFASILAEAKAIMRNRKKAETESQKIMRQYEQIVEPETIVPNGNGRHLKDVLKSLGGN